MTALYLATPGGALRRYDERDGLHLGAATGRSPGPVGWVKYCDNVPLVGDAPCAGHVIWGGATQWGIFSLAGGGPNEVFVGYHGGKTPGLTCGADPDPDWCDSLVHSGKIDRVRLNADGSITVDRFDYWENDLGMQYWHNRSPFRLLYDHVAHPGTLYVADEHGVEITFPNRFTPYAGGSLDTWQDAYFGDHAHALVCLPVPCGQPGSYTRAGDWRGLSLDAQGRLWHAGRWTAGLIPWNSNPVTWWTSGAFDLTFGDPYSGPGPGFRNEPVFKVPAEGDTVNLTAVSVCPDGRVWFASAGATSVNDTVAVWDPAAWAFKTFDARTLGLAEQGVQDLVCLPDGRIVLAGVTSGAAVYDPASGASKPLAGLPSAHVHRLG
ncbi:MAG TPA: WD40 repeat domain-containing protein, partial [Anaeromyxobacter sp.]